MEINNNYAQISFLPHTINLDKIRQDISFLLQKKEGNAGKKQGTQQLQLPL